MKVQASRADAFVAGPPAALRALLVYGPDAGLVRERAETAARTAVDDLSDPFRVVEIAAAALKDDPTRLAEEAAALSLTGGRRLVRLRGADDSVLGQVEGMLAAPGEALVIVEAGALNQRSKLRVLFETAENAAAVPCYLDDGEGLEALVAHTLRENGLAAEDGVVPWIAAHLGGDRMVTRMELEKLVLYAGGAGPVTLDDAQAVIGDSAAVTLDDVAFAAAGADLEALLLALARARFEGAQPVAVLRAASRHLGRIETCLGAMAAGASPDRAMKSLRPPVFFKQEGAFRAQLRRWRPETLQRARAELLQAEIDCKSTGTPDDAVCERTLMRIAAMAGAGARARPAGGQRGRG